MDIRTFLSARFDEEHADAIAAQQADPAPWRPDTSDGASTGLRSGLGAGLVIAADDQALWDCEGSHMLCMTAATARHVARWHPAQALAEIEAKRALLREIETITVYAAAGEADPDFLKRPAGRLLCAMASPYSGHPDCNPDWAL